MLMNTVSIGKIHPESSAQNIAGNAAEAVCYNAKSSVGFPGNKEARPMIEWNG